MNVESASPLSRSIIDAIRSVVGGGVKPLHEPYFNGNEWAYVKDSIDSTFVSSVGEYVDRFEEGLVAFTGAKHAIAVVNGTAALHIALLLAGVERGDEVLVPSLTFVATANSVRYVDAIPHFIDCKVENLGVDPEKLRAYLLQFTEQSNNQCINSLTKRVIRAIIPMHTFGHPCDIDKIISIAHDFKLKVIEDAAESLGSYLFGQHTGTFGEVGTLSFNGNKTITTGGGGAILTNDSELAAKAKHITTTAKINHAWEYRHDSVAFNYRLPNLNAALGCAQLESLPNILRAQRILYEDYAKAFNGVDGVYIFKEPQNCKSNYWLQTILIAEADEKKRDEILKSTNEAGLLTRPSWVLMHKLKQFQGYPHMDLSTANSLSKKIINIPSSPGLIRIQDE